MIGIKKLLSQGCSSSLTVGFGLSKHDFDETKKCLEHSECHLRLERYESARELVSALRTEKIDAAVRGTLSSAKVIPALRAGFKVDRIMRAAILESSSGRPFILAPVGIDEGFGLSARLDLVRHTLAYFSAVGWKLRIGVLSKGREEDGGRGDEIRKSIQEGEMLTRRLKADGRRATHFHILIEDAVKESDLVVAPDGITGNLMFRTLHFAGGGRAYGAPVVNLPRVFVDTSRAKSDFSEAALLAAGLAKVRPGTDAET